MKEDSKLKCNKCNNKTAAGESVPGHRFGDLICPKVQDGTIMCNPKWKEHAKKFPKVKIYDKSKVKKKSNKSKGPDASKLSKGKGLHRGPDGRFQINMVEHDHEETKSVQEWQEVETSSRRG